MNRIKISKYLFSTLLMFASLVLVLGIIRGESSLSSFLDLSKTKKELELRVDDLKQQNKDLANEMERIQSSPMYARKILKDKYHLTDKDEQLIFLP